jgi:hypothetical protein
MKTSARRRKLALFVAIIMVVGLWTALPAQAWAANDVSYIDEKGDLQAADNVTEITDDSITTLQDGWYIVKGEIDYSDRLELAESATVHLILADGCEYTIGKGIHVGPGQSLTIYAQSTGKDMGKLDATGGDNNVAVIGGNANESGGTITINGGTVTVDVSALNGNGAGIGSGGFASNGGTITINGGTVNAEGSLNGAAIGGGFGSNGGVIMITGGTIKAISRYWGAAIGGGEGGTGGTITITGGIVNAISEYAQGGAAIGGGGREINYSASGGTIVISGGIVTATSNNNGSAIGAGGGSSIGGSGTFTLDNNAIVLVTNSGSGTVVGDTEESHRTGGLLFENKAGTLYGDVTITGEVVVPDEGTLTVPDGKTLTIEESGVLTVDGSGTITIEEGGTVIVKGGIIVIEEGGTVTIGENGTLTVVDEGAVTGEGTLETEGSEPLSVALATVTVNGTYTYTGSAQTLNLTVKIVGTTLVEDEDYTVESNSIDAGPASYTITGMGDYNGTKTGTFTIDPKPITVTGIVFSDKPYDDTTAATPGETPTLDGIMGDDDVSLDDSQVSYNFVSAGIGRGITINRTGDYSLSGGKAANYTLTQPESSFSGNIIKATPTITAPPTATSINQGAALSTSKLAGGEASVAGTFAWTDGSVMPTASGSFGVTFTPNDETNYNTADTTVHVTVIVPAPTTYAVTVENGVAGSASYAAGATVTITANAPAEGKVFDTWTSDEVTFASATSATTTFVMPEKEVAVTATYKDDPNSGGDDPDPPVNPPETDDGWVYDNGVWKFFIDGVAQTGWVYDDGAWYYLNADGIMQTGWLYDSNYKAWYYLAGSGAMKTGWVKDNENWYYLAGNGAMKVGWFYDNDYEAWFYLSGNGKMLTGKQSIGGKAYAFKANGAWVS